MGGTGETAAGLVVGETVALEDVETHPAEELDTGC